jgi:hypothetical protein
VKESAMATDTMIRDKGREISRVAPAKIREIVVAADEAALNQALADRGVEPDKIVSVMLQPGQSMAIGDHGPKYRVLYRI